MNRGLSQIQKEAIIKEYLNINENLPKGHQENNIPFNIPNPAVNGRRGMYCT